MEERDAELAANFQQGVAGGATWRAHGTARDLALGNAGTDVVLRAVS